MHTVDTPTLKELRQQDVPIINVLPRHAYEEKHIPGSANVPVGSDDFVDQVDQLVGGRAKRVVVYCASSDCDASTKAAKRLEQAGYLNVADYAGGTAAWEKAGLDLVGSAA